MVSCTNGPTTGQNSTDPQVQKLKSLSLSFNADPLTLNPKCDNLNATMAFKYMHCGR